MVTNQFKPIFTGILIRRLVAIPVSLTIIQRSESKLCIIAFFDFNCHND